jgi:hypothetical protein
MVKIIFRISVVLILALLLAWLNNNTNSVHISLLSYSIDTTVVNLFVLLLFIYIPLRIIYKLIVSINVNLTRNSFLNNLASILDDFSNTERLMLFDLLKKAKGSKHIKTIKNIKSLIKENKNPQALVLLDNIIKNKDLAYISAYYKTIIYAKLADYANFSVTCKYAISHLKNNGYFFKELLLKSISTNNSSEIQYLSTIYKNINFENKADKNQTWCIINYYQIKELIDNKPDEAITMCKKLLSNYGDFIPAYELLIKLSLGQQNSNKIKDILKEAWLNNSCYEAIILWNKYFPDKDYNSVISFAKDLFKTSKNQENNNLLIAGISINFNRTLEAEEAIYILPEKHKLKKLMQLLLLEKQKNYKEINKFIIELYGNSSYSSWWIQYIK